MREDKIIQLLRRNSAISTGCTEPASISLCVSKAASVSRGKLESIKVIVDPGTYRNAYRVIIPGTKGMYGVELAAAIGYFHKDYITSINVFSKIKESLIEKAIKLLSENKVEAVIDNSRKYLFIDALVYTTEGVGRALVVNSHTNLICQKFFPKESLEEINDIFPQRQKYDDEEDDLLKNLSVSELYFFAKTISLDKISFFEKGAEINMRMARYCVENPSDIGRSMMKFMKKGIYKDDSIAEIQLLVSLSVEGRMRGIQLPVMTSWGSGNQGLVVTIPVYFFGKSYKKSKEEVIRALTFSNLIAGKIKTYLGSISSMCGTVIAGACGICAGYIYLNNGKDREVENGLNTIISSTTGVVCDGAKPECGLKAMVAVEVAIRAALLSLKNICFYSGGGILERTIERTLSNLETVEKIGMSEMKNILVGIIKRK